MLLYNLLFELTCWSSEQRVRLASSFKLPPISKGKGKGKGKFEKCLAEWKVPEEKDERREHHQRDGAR